MMKETSSGNHVKSAVDLIHSETSQDGLQVNDKQSSPPIYFDQITDIDKTQSHKKDGETLSFLASLRNGVTSCKSSIKAAEKTGELVTKSPVILSRKTQKYLFRNTSF